MVSYRKIGGKLVKVGGQNAKNAPAVKTIKDTRTTKQKNRDVSRGYSAGDTYLFSNEAGSFLSTPAGEGRVYMLRTPSGQTFQSSNLDFLKNKQLQTQGTITAVVGDVKAAANRTPKNNVELQGSYIAAGTETIGGRTLSQNLPVSENLAEKMKTADKTTVYYNEEGKIVSVGRPPDARQPTAEAPGPGGAGFTRGGSIQEAPQGIASRIGRSRPYAVASQFVRGFFSGRDAPDQVGGDPLLESSRSTGRAAMFFTAGLSGVPNAAKTTFTTTVNAVRAADTSLRSTKYVGPTYQYFVKPAAGAYASFVAIDKSIDVARPSYSVITSEYFKQARGESFRASQKPGFWNTLANDQSVVWGSDRSKFQAEFYNRMIASGLKPEEAERATSRALRERKIIGWAEPALTLGSEAVANFVGFKGVQAAYKTMGKVPLYKLKDTIIRKTTGAFMRAGAYEGTTSSLARSTLRDEKEYDYGVVKLNKWEQAAASGTVGALTAGYIGPRVLANAQVKGSRWLEIGGYILDPNELPGDALSTAEEKLVRTTFRRTPGVYTFVENPVTQTADVVRTPTTVNIRSTTFSTSPSQSSSASGKNTKMPSSSFFGVPSVSVSSSVPTFASSNIPSPSYPKSVAVIPSSQSSPSTSSSTKSTRGSFSVPTISTASNIPAVIPSTVPSTVSALVPSTVPSDVFSNVSSNVMSNVPTNANVIVPTNPFIPLTTLGGGGGGFKFKKAFSTRQKKGYTPSTYAALAGIKGKRPSKLAISSGLSVRPIISSKKMRSFFG